MADRKN